MLIDSESLQSLDIQPTISLLAQILFTHLVGDCAVMSVGSEGRERMPAGNSGCFVFSSCVLLPTRLMHAFKGKEPITSMIGWLLVMWMILVKVYFLLIAN